MTQKKHHMYYPLIAVSTFIILFGLIMLTSASGVIGIDTFNDPYYFLKHQIIFGLLPGIFFALGAVYAPASFFNKIVILLYIVTIMLLILVLAPDIGFLHGGAKRWILIGQLSIQPSEIAKLTSVLFLARWFSSKTKDHTDMYARYIPPLLYMGMNVLLIALQPDIGTLSVIIAITLSMVLIAGIPKRHFMLLLLLGVIFFAVIIKVAPYRLARITAYLNPEADTLGTSYQINQSLVAIGSGGLLGRGLGQSKQKYQYLPEVMGDSIFAVIAEELGFVLTSVVIIMYSYFIILIFRIAQKIPDHFWKYTSCGIATWFAVQTILNIGSMVRMVPLTGLPLPFVSYGGSSMIVSLIALGIVINASQYIKKGA